MLVDSEPKSIPTLSRRRLMGLLLAPVVASGANMLLPKNTLAESLPPPNQTTPAFISDLRLAKIPSAFTEMQALPGYENIYPQVTGERRLDVPFYRQLTDGTCARGAVCSVVNYYNAYRYIDEPDVVDALPEFARLVNDVVPSIAKLTYKERAGNRFTTNSSNWLNLIKSEIGYGCPVLVLVPNGKYLDWSWERAHYVVARGYNDDNSIEFVDPWKDKVNNPYGYWNASAEYFAKAWGAPQNSYKDAFGWQGVKTPKLYLS